MYLEEGSGWINVAWEIAAGVDLTAVTEVGSEGDVRTLASPGPSGPAVDVDALVFCGTVDPAVFPPPEEDEPTGPGDPDGDPDLEAPSGDGEPEGGDDSERGNGEDPGDGSEPAPAPTPEPAPSTDAPAEVTEGNDGAGTDPTPDPAGVADPPAEGTATDEEPDASVQDDPAVDDPAADDPAADEAPANDATSDSELEASIDDEAAPAEDVEVLGVQLSRDDEPAGPDWPMLLLMLGLGILAVGAALSLWRSWPTR